MYRIPQAHEEQSPNFARKWWISSQRHFFSDIQDSGAALRHENFRYRLTSQVQSAVLEPVDHDNQASSTDFAEFGTVPARDKWGRGSRSLRIKHISCVKVSIRSIRPAPFRSKFSFHESSTNLPKGTADKMNRYRRSHPESRFYDRNSFLEMQMMKIPEVVKGMASFEVHIRSREAKSKDRLDCG